MRLALPLAALCLALPVSAQDESRLDRMERLSTEFTTRIYSNALGGDLTGVDMEMAAGWDDEMRDAAGCVLDAYEAEGVSEDVDAVLDRMETIVAAPTTDFAVMMEETSAMGSIVPEDRAIEINQSCGMVDLQMQRMRESGLMDAMMERGSFE